MTRENARYAALKYAMRQCHISFALLGKKVGMSPAGISLLLQRSYCSHDIHQKLIALGFPKELLPLPSKHSKNPNFEGLRAYARQHDTDTAQLSA